jgi:hypothetical protein
MKEMYFKPESDVEEFKLTDVITTSGGEGIVNPDDKEPTDDNSTPYPW